MAKDKEMLKDTWLREVVTCGVGKNGLCFFWRVAGSTFFASSSGGMFFSF